METAEKVLPSVEANQEKDMRRTLASVSVFALLTGIPLFMTDKYFNITLSKFLYFAFISAMSFALSYTFRPENEIKVKSTENRKMDIAPCLKQFGNHRAFACTGRAGQHNQLTCLFFHSSSSSSWAGVSCPLIRFATVSLDPLRLPSSAIPSPVVSTFGATSYG